MSISNNTTGYRPGVCTSTTRPTAPYEGQMVYETDTDMVAIWNGTTWRYIAATTPTNGTVLQTVHTTVTSQPYISSTGYTDITGMTASITPKSTSSKILVQCMASIGPNTSDDTFFRLTRNGSAIGTGSNGANNTTIYFRGDNQSGAYLTLWVFPVNFSFLDSPSSTSSVTYTLQGGSRINGFYLNRRANDQNFSTISSITLMEIAG